MVGRLIHVIDVDPSCEGVMAIVVGVRISSDDPSSSSLKCIRRKRLHRIIAAHLNINSLRNKFDSLMNQIKGNVDILVISETKLDESFPVGQFKIPGFATPFCRDKNEFADF